MNQIKSDRFYESDQMVNRKDLIQKNVFSQIIEIMS